MRDEGELGRRRLLAGGVAASGLVWARPTIRSATAGVSTTSPPPTSTTEAATTTTEVPQQRFTLEPSCTDAEPYSMDLILQPLEEGSYYSFSIHVRYQDGTTYDDAYFFIAPRSLRIAHLVPNAVQPYEIEYVELYLDRDRDGTGDASDDPDAIIGAVGYFNVTQPCERFPGALGRSRANQRVEIRTS